MKHQLNLSSADFSREHKQMRREKFLKQMEQVVPWKQIICIIEPVYPKAGNGRQPYDLEQMLRIYCLQLWYNLSDPLMEEMLYDSRAMSEFAGIDLVSGKAPDETTIGNFRRLIEEHGLAEKIFAAINQHLHHKGITMSTGTIVDATIIAAPSSTKNKEGKRDTEMHQTKKGNNWHFGMKAHIGVDAESKMIHSIEVTSANIHDATVVDKLVRSTDEAIWGDKAYAGTKERIQSAAPKAEDKTLHKARRNAPLTTEQEEENRTRSKVRSRVEHCFGVMKNIFAFRKVSYKGLAKNRSRVFMTCALINIYLSRIKLSTAA
jgi:IS5 family transposase